MFKHFLRIDDLPLRLQYGLILLAGLVIIFVCVEWYERLTDLRSQVEVTQFDLAELKNLQTTQIWEDRLNESLVIAEQAQSQLWDGSTSGVIAAEIEKNIRNVLSYYGVSNVRISIDPTPSQLNTVTFMSFQISANIPAEYTPIPVLIDLSFHEKILLIEEVRFSLDARGSRSSNVNINGFAPISILPETSDENG